VAFFAGFIFVLLKFVIVLVSLCLLLIFGSVNLFIILSRFFSFSFHFILLFPSFCVFFFFFLLFIILLIFVVQQKHLLYTVSYN